MNGGTVNFDGSPTFSGVGCHFADDADIVNLSVTGGNILDLTSFTGGSGTTIYKTGLGAVKIASSAAYSLQVAEGVFVASIAPSPVPANVELADGVAIRLATKGITFDGFANYDRHTYEIDATAFSTGDTVFTATDQTVRQYVLDHLAPVGGFTFEEDGTAVKLVVRTAPVISTWTGAAGDGKWTTCGNWSEDVPGVHTNASGVEVGMGDDQAVFTNGVASQTIDLTGFVIVSNVTVTGESAPVYTFGTSSSQVLRLEAGGTFKVTADVPEAPVFVAKFGCGRNRADKFGCWYVENDSATELALPDYGYGLNYSSWAADYLYLRGTGSIRLDGVCKNVGSHAARIVAENTYDPETGRGTLTVNSDPNLHKLMVQGGSVTHKIVITAGHKLSFKAGGSYDFLSFDCDTYITGEGTIEFGSQYNGSEKGMWANGTTYITSGKTVTIDCLIAACCNGTPTGGFKPGIRLNGSGIIVMEGDSSIEGEIMQIASGKLKTASIGAPGVKSAFGIGDTVVLGSGAYLTYTGSGETATRNLVLTNGIIHVEQAGTGDFTVAMPLANRAANATIYLMNTRGSDGLYHDGIWSAPITDGTGPLSLIKLDSGRWILSGANTFTGSTSIEGGTVTLTGSGSLASSSGVTVTGGSTLECTTGAAMSLEKVTVDSGANILKISGATTLTLGAIARTGLGTLDIVTDGDSASVRVQGMKTTSAQLPWLTINGKASGFDAEGKVIKCLIHIDTEIAAKGGEIPDDSTKNVGITSVGSGDHVTLAGGGSVAASALAQLASVQADVEIPAGETLTVGGLYVNEGASPLTVGGFAADGTMVSGSSTFTFYPEGTDSVITVKAPVSMQTATKVIKQGDGVARLDGGGFDDWSGAAEIIKGTLAVSNAAGLKATLSGGGTFEFGGGATAVTLSKEQTGGFTGTFKVSSGTVKPTTVKAFGDTTTTCADIMIASNAVVDLTGLASNASFGRRGFNIAGDASLVFSSSSGYYADHLSLNGDAVIDGIGSGKYLNFRGLDIGYPSISDFGGHTLYKRGHGIITFQDSTVTNAGKIVLEDVEGASKTGFVFYRGTDVGSESDPPIVMGNGSVIYMGTAFNPGSKPFRRHIEVTGTNAVLNTWALGRSTNENSWAGAVTLKNSDSVLNLTPYDNHNNYQVAILGPIDGKGSIVCSNHGRCVMANENNTYEGTTRLEGGANTSLFLAYPRSIPSDYSRLTINNGRVAVCYMGEDDLTHWQKASILAFANAANCTTGSEELYPRGLVAVDASEAPDGTCELELSDSDITGEHFGIGADGGRIELSGETTKIETLGSYRGTFAITGGSHTFDRAIASSDGTNECGILSFEGGSTTIFTKDAIAGMIGWNDYCLGRIRVTNATLRAESTPETGGFQYFKLGYQRNSGILEIGDGANVKAGLHCGTFSDNQQAAGGSWGAVHMSGGSFTAWGTVLLPSCYADDLRSYGFLDLMGGTYEQSGPSRLNSSSKETVESCGLVYQSGGTFRHNKRGLSDANYMWRIGGSRDSVTTVYRTGGSMKVDGQIYLINQNEYFTNSVVQWTQGTGAGRAECDYQFIMAANNYVANVLNLNGGVLSASAFYKYAGTTGSRVDVNFNGGAVEVKGNEQNLFGSEEAGNVVDRITVFAGGAEIAVTNTTVAMSVPLQAPEGNGVVSIPAPEWKLPSGRTFVGPPTVWIVDAGGTGHGASAIVEYDAATCRPGAVVVTSPGCNYTSAKAYFRYGRETWTNDCVLGESLATGGFVKSGEGTLVLNAANGYGGTTTVKDGVLTLGVAGAIPSESQIVLEGGFLEPNGQSVDFSKVTFAGGGIKGNVTLPTAISIDFNDVLDGKTLTIDGTATIVPDTVISVTNVDTTKLDPSKRYTIFEVKGDLIGGDNLTVSGLDELPEKWELQSLNGNKKIKLVYMRGFTLLVK